LKLLNFFGIGAPPATTDPVELHTLYGVSTIAIFSAVNTLGEIWDCYGAQIAEVILTIVEGKEGVGVTIAEARDGFTFMLANPEGWIPNAVKPTLLVMTTQALEKLADYRPFGTSEVGNLRRVSQQTMYKRTCFRVDVENLVGTNFKE
jgi:hypothetical protein